MAVRIRNICWSLTVPLTKARNVESIIGYWQVYAQHYPLTQDATKGKDVGWKLYILINFYEKYGSKYNIFSNFCEIHIRPPRAAVPLHKPLVKESYMTKFLGPVWAQMGIADSTNLDVGHDFTNKADLKRRSS